MDEQCYRMNQMTINVVIAGSSTARASFFLKNDI
jgi:hypothetical protein